MPSSSRSSRLGSTHASKHANIKNIQRIDAFVVHKKEQLPTPLGGKCRHRLGNNNNNNNSNGSLADQITLSQIDPGVLRELPRELQDELLRQLRPPLKKLKKAEKKKVAAKAAAEEAAQQRQLLEELQAAQVAGSSDEEESIKILEDLGDFGDGRFSSAVQMLIRAAIAAERNVAAASDELLDKIDSLLHAMNAAVEEYQEISNRSHEDEDEEVSRDFIERVLYAALVCIGKCYIARNLEGARRLLLRIQDLGMQYTCFACCAEELIVKLQQRVTRRYGWPLALRSPQA